MNIPVMCHVGLGLLVLMSLGCMTAGTGQDGTTGQHPRALEKDVAVRVKLPYLLYLPEAYGGGEEDWPLILFLHGAGERGDDLEKVKKHGPPKLIAKQGRSFPFVIASPQCPRGGWWSSDVQVAALDALLSDLTTRYRIDEKRVYLTGLSMGGFGTWRLASLYPERFAAIAPICGGGEPEMAEQIGKLPTWVFHGAKDSTVPVEKSEVMVEALRKAGNEARFTVYPEAGHDSWTETYDNPDLYDWFLEHRR